MEDSHFTGRFVPGQSGNPKGRPKAAPTAQQFLETLSLRAACVLDALLESNDDRVRLEAAKEILDRTIGKPEQRSRSSVELFSSSVSDLAYAIAER